MLYSLSDNFYMSRSKKRSRAKVKQPSQTTTVTYTWTEETEGWLAVIASRGVLLDTVDGETLDEVYDSVGLSLEMLKLNKGAVHYIDRSVTPEEKIVEAVAFFSTRLV